MVTCKSHKLTLAFESSTRNKKKYKTRKMNNNMNIERIYRNCNINYNMDEMCIDMINDNVNYDEHIVNRTG